MVAFLALFLGGLTSARSQKASFANGVLLSFDPGIQSLTPSSGNQLNVVNTSVQGGNVVVSFADSPTNPTEQSVMTWDVASHRLIKWSFNFDEYTATFADAANQGYPGSLVLTSGSTDSLSVSAGKGYYSMSGNLLVPYLYAPDGYDTSTGVQNFVCGGQTYQLSTSGMDPYGNQVVTYTAGASTCQTLYTDTGLFQIGFPGVPAFSYQLNPTGTQYVLQGSPAPANNLTTIDGDPLTVSGSTCTLPSPAIQSFVWNGRAFSLAGSTWNSGSLIWNYTEPNGVMASASCQTGGVFASLFVQDSSSVGYLTPGNTAGSYQVTYASNSTFTSFNHIPYALLGSGSGSGYGQLVPEGPMSTFTYGANAYQFTGSSMAADGNWVSSYQGANGQGTATVEYSPTTGEMVKLTVHPVGAGTATYVDGATVGKPGAYVWSNTSSRTNQLSAVNGQSYTVSGDLATRTNAVVNNNGIFDINGDYMTLGIWSNDANQSGMSLSYDDGIPVSVPATVAFTASRPLTRWSWEAAISDGTATSPMMMLDETSRLLLYPASDDSDGAPAVPAPTVILDPAAGGTSSFAGSVSVKGVITAAPGGDIPMYTGN